MIVTPEEVKDVLEIPSTDTSADAHLTALIAAATTWVEGETHRKFDGVEARVEYHEGHGFRKLYLKGRFEELAENPSEVASILVFRRPLAEPFREWEQLIELEDWERRANALIYLAVWGRWPTCDEFRVEYPDGYLTAPADIKQLIINLVVNQYLFDVENAAGTAGITGEDIGDYSYTVDLGAVATGFASSLSARDRATLEHYKRKFL